MAQISKQQLFQQKLQACCETIGCDLNQIDDNSRPDKSLALLFPQQKRDGKILVILLSCNVWDDVVLSEYPKLRKYCKILIINNINNLGHILEELKNTYGEYIQINLPKPTDGIYIVKTNQNYLKLQKRNEKNSGEYGTWFYTHQSQDIKELYVERVSTIINMKLSKTGYQ